MKKAQQKPFQFFTLGGQSIVAWAICTDLPQDEAIAHANSISPTGISSRWQLSEEKFPDGKDNPHVCSENLNSKHYLLTC